MLLIKRSIKVSASFLLLISNFAVAGGEAGNGGDPVRILLAQAKHGASKEVLSITKEKIAKMTSNKVGAWLSQEQMVLAQDILGSEHIWVEEEKATCATTGTTSMKAIVFSFPTCRKMLDPSAVALAEKLLIHESVHHLGIEEEQFADSVANEIYNVKDDAFLCRMGDSSGFEMVKVDFNKQVGGGKGIDTPNKQYSIRFNNYAGHLYATVFQKSPGKRVGMMSLIGDYGSLSIAPNGLGISCSRIK